MHDCTTNTFSYFSGIIGQNFHSFRRHEQENVFYLAGNMFPCLFIKVNTFLCLHFSAFEIFEKCKFSCRFLYEYINLVLVLANISYILLTFTTYLVENLFRDPVDKICLAQFRKFF